MLTGEALEIVIDMAKELRATCEVQREDIEMEAIEEVEFLLKGFDDDEDYDEDEYVKRECGPMGIQDLE